MHSIYQRINGISALLSSCLLALLGAIAVSSLAIQTYRGTPTGALEVTPLRVWVKIVIPIFTISNHWPVSFIFISFVAPLDLPLKCQRKIRELWRKETGVCFLSIRLWRRYAILLTLFSHASWFTLRRSNFPIWLKYKTIVFRSFCRICQWTRRVILLIYIYCDH